MARKFAAAVPALLLLSACSGLQDRIERGVDDGGTRNAELMRDVGRTAPGVVMKSAPPVAYNDGIWLGKNVVKVGQPTLPTVFYEPATFDRTVHSLAELAERIALRSGIPTKVSPDALAIADGTGQPATQGAAGSSSAAKTPLPAGMPTGGASRVPGLDAVPGLVMPGTQSGVRISYANGNLKGLLDTAAARFGVSWKHVDGVIQFYHTDSRTFQISAIPGDSTFSATVASGATSSGGVSSGGASGGRGGGGGGGGGGGSGGGGVSSNNAQNTAVTSKLSVYTSIEDTIKAMLSPYGKVVSSPATGAITVVDTPDSLDRIAGYVDTENKSLSRQVVINVTVLSVSTSDSDEYGINWQLFYQTLHRSYGMVSALPVSTGSTLIGAKVIDTSRLSSTTAIINALSKQGKVRRQTTASVVTLNNQPVPVQVARQTSYLRSSETTMTAQVGSITTLMPGTVTAGFNMSILPHVLTNGTVLLQFSTDISALRNLRPVESNGARIEVPEMDTRNFLQRVAMKSNETLIISGFEQTDDNLDKQGVGQANNYALGGGFKAGTTKESIVILITPTTTATGT
jgi:type IVB pilus formation R64 PilN family outer membrane protein